MHLFNLHFPDDATPLLKNWVSTPSIYDGQVSGIIADWMKEEENYSRLIEMNNRDSLELVILHLEGRFRSNINNMTPRGP